MGSGRGAARQSSLSTNCFWRYLCRQIKFFINQLEERRGRGAGNREKRQRPSARREPRMNHNHQQNTVGHRQQLEAWLAAVAAQGTWGTAISCQACPCSTLKTNRLPHNSRRVGNEVVSKLS